MQCDHRLSPVSAAFSFALHVDPEASVPVDRLSGEGEKCNSFGETPSRHTGSEGTINET